MVKMVFYIRFRGQLRRTKPEIISSLEDKIAGAVSAAGGSAAAGHKVLGASFDEDRIGFWLGMVIFLEKVREALEDVRGELYGYALALGEDNAGPAVPRPASGSPDDFSLSEISMERFCRFLSGRGRSGSTGIWCSSAVREALGLYAAFGDVPLAGGDDIPESAAGDRGNRALLQEGYRELREWKTLDAIRREYPYREKIVRALVQGNGKNTILLGPELIGKRDGIYRYCAGLLSGIPPLTVRFGAGGLNRANDSGPGTKARRFLSERCGLVCFADAFTPDLRAFISGAVSAKTLEELDGSGAILFRERLREEWSPYMLDQGGRFLRCLLGAYAAAVKTRGSRGVLILEEPSLADSVTVKVFREIYSSLDDRESLIVLAADNSSEDKLKDWGTFFKKVLKFAPEELPPGKNINLTNELWELSYNISLLGRYFPDYLFPQLFEEEGLNRELYFRALKTLEALGAVEGKDPRPGIPNFTSRAQRALGEKKTKIRSAVRGRILAWTKSGRLRLCFNLLRILPELGERAEDALVLKAIKADVLNGTWEAIEDALGKSSFGTLVGAANIPVLLYIFRTFKALVRGNKNEIERVFEAPAPPLTGQDGTLYYGAFRAQVYTNLAAYYIGRRNFDSASEILRQAMVLNRTLGENAVPAHRLFSLLNFSRQRVDDALEYITFALDQSEKNEQNEELIITRYFASSINLLYGNLSRAERLAVKAEETALALGQAEWAARAGFLRGRLCFEIGRYARALEIFTSLDSAPYSAGGSAGKEAPAAALRKANMADTVRAWINRTRIILGHSGSAEPEFPPGFDGRLFEIEAAYSAGDFKKAVESAGCFLSDFGAGPEGDEFLFTEQPDWSSGFAQCELMFQPGKVPGIRLAWVYRALAQCAVESGPAAKAEILDAMQRFMREEHLPDTDPNGTFYFYAWYSMLRDTGAAQVDLDTVVSMAYKRLQRRAGKIDDAAAKQDFLVLPRWNNTLSLAAREYKLI